MLASQRSTAAATGNEVAARSAVVMDRKGISQAEVTMTIDRPFLFLVRDNANSAVLFLGQVLDPGKISWYFAAQITHQFDSNMQNTLNRKAMVNNW